jgi:dipeptidyl aminopeptidase/acylaminoacyl peptidase
MTLKQISELQYFPEISISPDGTRVAAVRTVPRRLFDEDDGKAWAELVVVETTTGVVRPFVTGQVNVKQVAWLPDGSAISFLAKRDGDAHVALYLIPADGGEAVKILGLSSDITGYDWDPAGEHVAAIAQSPQSDDDTKLEDQGFNQTVFEEDSRPLDVWIARVGDDGPSPRSLGLDGSAHQVEWAPDGTRLAVAVAPSALVDDRYMFQKVHVVKADSGEITAVVDYAGKLGAVQWSPDGRHLAINSGVDIHDPAISSLFVVPADGGIPTNLTAGFAGAVGSVRWLDGDQLVFLGDVGVGTDLFTVPADGATAPTATGLLAGDVVYTKLDIAEDLRTAALIGDSSDFPSEVFTGRIDRGSPRRITVSNPWLDGVRLARQETVRNQARDGLELEGIVIYPLDYQEGVRYPLVMIVHGGPESHHRNGWMTRYSNPAQVLAARGFVVFFSNYRGSTGRGVEFSKLSQADPAGAEFDDLVDAVDHLVDIGLVDRDRVGITGGSYGGYATAWCSTRYTERFAAGVMFVGISNKISKYGTTDIPQEELLVHARKRVYDDFGFALERSPITHTKGAKTPLLILHGTDDPRVSVTQSEELYRALKTTTSTPVRLVLYPGEEHGNRRAAAQYDFSVRLLRWMEHYLKGGGGAPPEHRIDYVSPENGWDVGEN